MEPRLGFGSNLQLRGLPLWLSWLRICLQCGWPRFDPWTGKIPWRREQLPAPTFWLGEFHGQHSCKESDTTDQLSHLFIQELLSPAMGLFHESETKTIQSFKSCWRIRTMKIPNKRQASTTNQKWKIAGTPTGLTLPQVSFYKLAYMQLKVKFNCNVNFK